MDRKSYENVLSDLESEITIKRAEVEKLNQEILQDENVISVLRMRLSQEDITVAPQISEPESIEPSNNDFTLLSDNENTEKKRNKISLGNTCEKILQSEGKPLYIKDLIQRIKEYGRITDTRQLSGTIRKDHKNRFINLGGNTWDLRERHPEQEENQ